MSKPITALALLSALSAAGCLGSLGGSLPAVELYRIAPVHADSASERGPAVTPGTVRGSIAITRYDTPGIYSGHGIVYRVEQSGYGVYPNREWAIPLGEMLGSLTEGLLSGAPLSAERAVYAPPSMRAFTYSWRGTVKEFEEVDRGKAVFAAVALEARLVRTSDDSVVWQATRRVEQAVPESTMPAIVNALSALARQAISELSADARMTVGRLGAGSPTGTHR
ncbi:MAG: ABC-type transport auxiliary lipoprotein family protein [Gemmatimonadota bacterium]|nr:ABC-type transport auxiliary lipoprotein family protein [Gemmatimonadota bacterium]